MLHPLLMTLLPGEIWQLRQKRRPIILPPSISEAPRNCWNCCWKKLLLKTTTRNPQACPREIHNIRKKAESIFLSVKIWIWIVLLPRWPRKYSSRIWTQHLGGRNNTCVPRVLFRTHVKQVIQNGEFSLPKLWEDEWELGLYVSKVFSLPCFSNCIDRALNPNQRNLFWSKLLHNYSPSLLRGHVKKAAADQRNI